VIILLLILSIGSLMEAGFEQILILQNDLVRSVSEIFDTYVYKNGIRGNKYSFTTAIGVFKSVVSMILLYSANKAAKLIGEEGLL
jgi:putative aldouronate transport system permease protein